ncbi:hypothetical protein Ade02nite_50540 [Paractinoplanes deccanensis]|uniref:Uncharacterized protein n=2 Tax=Paractinoplanes deccanensis TaxID=113561 RepID=A0ABQ3Y8W6_9ACTN|nr:hypothetical protein Ade02nite_50540 [Actinoplanes deccanensis]
MTGGAPDPVGGSAAGAPGPGNAPIGAPAVTRPGPAGSGAVRSRPARVPRPSWLPDDPVGPDRHQVPQPAQTQGAPRRARGPEAPVGYEPDNAWQVAEGVAPVIVPDRNDDRHDPGPQVIGRRG